jgi:hypothetical protein
VIIAFVLGWLSSSAPLSAQPGGSGRADPASFLTGELNHAAVTSVREFGEFPLVWLGEEHAGYYLTNVMRRIDDDPTHPLGGRNSLSLVYGSCIPVDEERPSCVPPFTVIVWAPGSAPRPDQVEPTAAGPMRDVRGLEARDVSTGTMLWTDGGITITVHSNVDMRAELLDALELANANVVGLNHVGAAAPLDSLDAWR